MPATPSRVAITGATGFLGPYLMQAFLASGYLVRAVVRNANHPALTAFTGKIEIAQADLHDDASLVLAFAGTDYAVHSAALVSFATRQHEALRQVNALGTAAVVDAALAAGVRKLVYVSSVAALGRNTADDMITEETRWTDSPGNKPYNSQYGYTKYLGEKQVARGVAEGLPAVIANPATIIGAPLGSTGGWQHGPAQFFPTLYKGFPFYPTGMNGFVAAADVANAVRLLLESGFAEGERFLLVGENLFYRELIRYICNALQRPEPRWPMPTRLMLPAAAAWELLSNLVGHDAMINHRTVRTTAHISQYDSSRFRTTFGYTFTAIKTVVEETAAAYLAHRQTLQK